MNLKAHGHKMLCFSPKYLIRSIYSPFFLSTWKKMSPDNIYFLIFSHACLHMRLSPRKNIQLAEQPSFMKKKKVANKNNQQITVTNRINHYFSIFEQLSLKGSAVPH